MGGLLRGKRAIITGARRGIGRAILQVFAEEGADIWACIRREDDSFVSSIEELQVVCEGSIHTCIFDLLDDEAVKAAVKEIRRSSGGIDVLVNCAGVFPKNRSFVMTPMDEIVSVMNANLIGPMRFTQYVIRAMNADSSIINISSIAVDGSSEGQYAYSCSKAAIDVWTKMLAQELGPSGIRVNAISPGMIATSMIEGIQDEVKNDRAHATALGRIGLPSEVASVAVFLASSLSDYVSGQVIRVNGGV